MTHSYDGRSQACPVPGFPALEATPWAIERAARHHGPSTQAATILAFCGLVILLATIVWTTNALQPKAHRIAGRRSYPRSCQSLCSELSPCSASCNLPDGTAATCGASGVCYAPSRLNP